MGTIENTILELEERLWEANRKGDAASYEMYVADDGIAIASFGVFDKEAILKQIEENRIPYTKTQIENPCVIVLSDVNAIVTYTAHIEALRDGQPLSFSVYATSVWTKASGEWKDVLHQQTPIQSG